MKRISLFFLFAFTLFVSVSAPAQDKIVTLTATGQGVDKNEATRNALRSAIEQAYGAFVSSDLTILNDDIVKDEVATISSGNIKSYKEVSYAVLSDNSSVVVVEAVVAPQNLISYSRAKGAVVTVDGGLFAIDRQMRELNRQNELVALQNLEDICKRMAPDVFDVELIFDTYKEKGDGKYSLPLTIKFKKNKACEDYWDFVLSTLESIAMSEDEIASYKQTDTKMSYMSFAEGEVDLGRPYSPSPKYTTVNYWFRQKPDKDGWNGIRTTQSLLDHFLNFAAMPITSKAVILSLKENNIVLPVTVSKDRCSVFISDDRASRQVIFRQMGLCGCCIYYPLLSMLSEITRAKVETKMKERAWDQYVRRYTWDRSPFLLSEWSFEEFNAAYGFECELLISENTLFQLQGIEVKSVK